MGRDEATAPPQRQDRPRFGTGLLLVAVALVARIVAAIQYEVIPRDGIDFLRQAGYLLDGNWRAALDWYQHPLTAALFAAASRVTGLDPESAASIAALGCGALAVIPIYILGARLFGRRAGLAAGLLFAILPVAVRLSVRPLSEGPFHLFFLTSVAAAAIAVERHSVRAAGITGLAGGLAFLSRPEGLAAPLAGAALLVLWPAAGASWRRRLGLGLLIGLGLVITVGPYVAHLSHTRGRLTLSAKKDVTVLAGADASRPVQPLSDEGLIDRPGKTTLELGRHLGEALTWAPLFLAVLGLAYPGRRRSRGAWLLLLLAGLLLLVLFRVGLCYGYVARRHLLTPGLLLLPWAGAGAAVLAAAMAGRRSLRAPDGSGPRPARTLAAVLGLFALGLLPVAWKPVDARHVPLKTLGERVRAQLGPGLRLAPLGFPRVAYYAGAPHLAILPEHQDAWCDAPPPGALEALGDALDRASVTHVVLSSRQPAGPHAWIDANAIELFRMEERDGDRWWAICRYCRGGAP